MLLKLTLTNFELGRHLELVRVNTIVHHIAIWPICKSCLLEGELARATEVLH